MKKLSIIVCITCCSMGLLAQNAPGKFSVKPMAGINVSTFAGDNSDFFKSKVGFTGGAEVEYGINNWLGLSLGMMYSQQGSKVEISSTTEQVADWGEEYTILTTNMGKLKTDYLNLPLMVNFYIPSVRGLSVKTGIQLGILTSGKLNMEMESKVIEVPNYSSYYYPIPPKVDLYMTEFCKSVDFGIPVGISYEYKNIVLDARYYFGLTSCVDGNKIPKDFYSLLPISLEDIKNRHFSVTLGYRFHL